MDTLTQSEIDKLYIPICITTGEEFQSLKEACNHAQVSSEEFISAIVDGQAIHNNIYDFKFVPYSGQSYDEPEVWKDLEHCRLHYQISNYGNFRKFRNDGSISILKDFVKRPKNTTYYTVNYSPKIGIHVVIGIHRLVAKYFIPNPYNLPIINHKDGDIHNNYYKNLEWCTVRHNDLHAINIGLHDLSAWKDSTHECHKKAVKCVETTEIFESMKSAGEHFDVHPTTILQRIRDPDKYIQKLDGLHFEFLNLAHNNTHTTGIHRFVKPVMCVETGQKFESLESAGDYFDVSYSVISDLAHHKSTYSKLLPGLHFEFI